MFVCYYDYIRQLELVDMILIGTEEKEEGGIDDRGLYSLS